jgi:hypothetical protein
MAQRRVRRFALGGGWREEKGRGYLGQYEFLGREREHRHRCVAFSIHWRPVFHVRTLTKFEFLKKKKKNFISERVWNGRKHAFTSDGAFAALQAGRTARC